MSEIEIKDWYEHEHKHKPSIFIMFTKKYELTWSYSGNELRRVYLESPGDFASGPIEVPIPDYLDKDLHRHIDAGW